MRIALYQPDIPQNLGALIRLSACFGIPMDVIEPCGFPLGDRGVRRAAMDYGELANITRHESWPKFVEEHSNARLVLLTTRGDTNYTQFCFSGDDCLVVGRESAGVPQDVHEIVAVRLAIPMREGARSLNVATAAAMVLGEALRQTGQLEELKAAQKGESHDQ